LGGGVDGVWFRDAMYDFYKLITKVPCKLGMRD
jgi:hypothetical protein